MAEKEKKKKKKVIDLLFITSCISTWLVLLLIALVCMLLLSAGKLSSSLRQEMTVEVILNEGVQNAQVISLEQALKTEPYCLELKHITKEQALEDMSAQMGTDPSMFLGYNPFYASLEMKLQPDYACSDSLEWIAKQIGAMENVSEVTWQKQLMDIVNSNISKIAGVLFILALILSLVSVALINNTIKLTIYSQRFTLYSMKLVGAKWSFIRRPFIWRNALIGIVSALMTCATIWFGMKYAIRQEPWLVMLSGKEIMIPTMAVVTLTGLLITCLCALHSVNRFLRMKSGELHFV